MTDAAQDIVVAVVSGLLLCVAVIGLGFFFDTLTRK